MHQNALATRPAGERLPPILITAILALILTSLALVTVARLTGMEPVASPPPSAIIAERVIVIDGSLGGGATVRDADGALIAELDPTEAGFINGVHRALGRTRMLHAVDPAAPVRLIAFADGRLGLRDPETGWRVELIGFGDTNRDAFAALLN